MSGITVPKDYNNDKQELNQEELLASLVFTDNATEKVQYQGEMIREMNQNDFLYDESRQNTIKQNNNPAFPSGVNQQIQEESLKYDSQNINQSNRSVNSQKVLMEQTQQISGKILKDQLNKDFPEEAENRNFNNINQNFNSKQTFMPAIQQQESFQNQDLNYQQQTPLRHELLTITIDLGNGNQDQIAVYDGDKPLDLARDFAIKHSLNIKLTDLLAVQIQNNIDQVIQEKLMKQQQDEMLYFQNQQQQQQLQNNPYNSSGYEQEEFNQYGDYSNPLEGTTKINDDTSNNTTNNFLGQLAEQKYYQTNNLSNYFTKNQKGYNSGGVSPQRPEQPQHNVYSNSKTKYNAPIIQGTPYINEKSRKLAMQKRPQSSQQPVHLRLYHQELEKTKVALAIQQQKEQEYEKMIKKQLRSPKRQPEDPNDLNFGVRLYQKGVKKQEERIRICKQNKEIQEKQIDQELSFKPSLITRKRDKSQGALGKNKREEELIQYGKNLNEKKERARLEIQHYEESKYNHRPMINKKSAKIIQEKSSFMVFLSPEKKSLEQQMKEIHGPETEDQMAAMQQSNKFAELYEEAKQRKERQDKIYSVHLDKECTFKPHLVTKDSKLTKSVLQGGAIEQSFYQQPVEEPHIRKEATPGRQTIESIKQSQNYTTTPVFDRLVQVSKDKFGKQIIVQLRNDENIDPQTGKPYFYPQTGRSPKNRPVEVKYKIGEHLYNQHKQIQEKHNKLKRDEEQKLSEMRKQIHMNHKNTDKIVDTSKKQKILDIFDIFDSDQDQVISASKIDLHTLPTDILEVFSPLLCEMEEIGTTLDRDEFLDASLRLYDTLNVHQRNLILQFRRVPKQNVDFEIQDCTFYPQVNPKSMKIAEKQQLLQNENQSFTNQDSFQYQGAPMTLPERLLKKKMDVDSKIRHQQEEKEKNELVGCTFHPNILTSMKANQYYSNIFTFGAGTFQEKPTIQQVLQRQKTEIQKQNEEIDQQLRDMEDMISSQFSHLIQESNNQNQVA